MKKKIILSDKFLMFVLILSGCFQNIEIISVADGFGLKLYHVVSIMLGIRLLIKIKENGKIKIPPLKINLFFIFILGLSFFMYGIYGFNSLCVNYIFAYYLIILIINIGCELKYDDWIEIIKKVATIMMICIFVNMIINFSQIKFFLSGNTERIVLNTFFGGGINLEATWLALLGVFFLKDEKAYIYLFLSMIVSMLYSSRSGMIVDALFFLIILFQENNRKNEKFKKTLLLLLLCVVLFVINIKTGMFSYILNRFTNLGNENGSLGRLNMWKYVLPSINYNPFGYGLGNAVKSIISISGIQFRESNVHNMFFQMALDTGVLGFLIYLWINLKFIFDERKNIIKNSVVSFITIYIALSFIEFRGADFLLYVMISIYILIKNERKEKSENSGKSRIK